jgi:hypothetical protein
MTATAISGATGAIIDLTANHGVVITLVLIALLVAHELTGAASDPQVLRWRRALTIGIVPLLFAFAVIVVTRIAHAL